MAKREASGYLHSISPMKKSKKSEFFTATLQQETEYKKLVVFSPQKHQTLKIFEDAQTPIKISNIGIGKSKDFLIFPSSIIQAATDTKFKHQPPTTVITPLDQVNNDIIGRPINIKIKIKSAGQPEEIKPGMTKKDCIATDSTGTMRLAVWNQEIKNITPGISYNIEGAIAKVYNEEMYLTTSMSSLVSPCDEDILEHEDADEFILAQPAAPEPTTVNNVIGVMKMDNSLVCSVCQKKTEPKQNPKLVHCSHCQMTRLRSQCQEKIYASVQLDKIPHIVNFFTEHLQQLRDSYNDDEMPLLVTLMSLEQMEEMLLSLPPLQIGLKNNSLVSLTIVEL